MPYSHQIATDPSERILCVAYFKRNIFPAFPDPIKKGEGVNLRQKTSQDKWKVEGAKKRPECVF